MYYGDNVDLRFEYAINDSIRRFEYLAQRFVIMFSDSHAHERELRQLLTAREDSIYHTTSVLRRTMTDISFDRFEV